MPHAAGSTAESATIDTGSRRELLIDGHVIERLTGKAALRQHQPTPQGVVMKHDEPWEGNACGFHSIFQDGGRYRMYYDTWHFTVTATEVSTDAPVTLP